MKRKQEYFEGFEPFKEEEEIIEEEKIIEPIFENQITFEEIAQVVRRQNIASSPGGDKLGIHEPGEIKILEEKDGWVRIDRGWLEKCYLKNE